MSLFDTIRRAVAGKRPTTADELLRLISQAGSERDQVRKRLEALRADEGEKVLDESAWRESGVAIADCERELLRYDRVIASLQDRHAIAQESEAADECKRAHANADRRANEVAATIDGRLASIANEVQSLLRDIANAQAAVDAANANPPAGSEYLIDVELRGRSVRQPPFRSERRKVKAWVNVSTGHIAGAEVPKIQIDPRNKDVGYVSISGRRLNFDLPPPYSFEPQPPGERAPGYAQDVQKYVRQDVWEGVEYYNGNASYEPPRLASQIALPPIRHAYGEPDGWNPSGMSSARAILEQLDDIAAQRSTAEMVDCKAAPVPEWVEGRRYFKQIETSDV
ncbi:hypothetical protein [Chelatococcus asaccharovorans]|uniref:hypothetical protein n=1 Tax=Chelatococcus asaccharovorans TaxID=28210 RepID=UPI00224C65B5|nr:hypothetical protein [Chelatococcus asaccharovorans]CAH1649799.1 hypothetical protein CHELA40_10275 [Chelatococcus asaccharovorans]CAH1686894.1 hypothetical protein CHELA17_65335 [Chelatococcus asaccharovorans]